MMKNITIFLCVMLVQCIPLYAVTSGELMQIHNVSSDDMNNIENPIAGTLVYNSTEKTLYFYTGTMWKKMNPSSSSKTAITASDGNIVLVDTNNSIFRIGL
jgi:hypothetical protein